MFAPGTWNLVAVRNTRSISLVAIRIRMDLSRIISSFCHQWRPNPSHPAAVRSHEDHKTYRVANCSLQIENIWYKSNCWNYIMLKCKELNSSYYGLRQRGWFLSFCSNLSLSFTQMTLVSTLSPENWHENFQAEHTLTEEVYVEGEVFYLINWWRLRSKWRCSAWRHLLRSSGPSSRYVEALVGKGYLEEGCLFRS